VTNQLQLIIIIIIIISFMQGIYTYIPETNYVPREYSKSNPYYRSMWPRGWVEVQLYSS